LLFSPDLLFDAFSSREPVPTSLENATHLFDAFSSREPVSTPHQVRGRLSLENAINQNSIDNSALSLGDAKA
jgi:hypothetical protein